MKDKESIGKKVWVICDNDCTRIINKDKVFTIVSVLDFKEAKDFCNHVILRADDGEEKEIREYDCVFILNPELEGDEQIDRFLADNGLYPDGVYTNSEGTTSVEISWGDWKHQHIYCDCLMKYLGYETECEEEVTEENGSDCYSAIHYYHKVA